MDGQSNLTSHIARCSTQSSVWRSSDPRRDGAHVGSVCIQLHGGGIHLTLHGPEVLRGLGQPRLFISECIMGGRNPTREGQQRLTLEHDLLGKSLHNEISRHMRSQRPSISPQG